MIVCTIADNPDETVDCDAAKIAAKMIPTTPIGNSLAMNQGRIAVWLPCLSATLIWLAAPLFNSPTLVKTACILASVLYASAEVSPRESAAVLINPGVTFEPFSA